MKAASTRVKGSSNYSKRAKLYPHLRARELDGVIRDWLEGSVPPSPEFTLEVIRCSAQRVAVSQMARPEHSWLREAVVSCVLATIRSGERVAATWTAI